MELRVLAGFALFTLTSCSSHVDRPRRAVADLEGSTAAGISYLDFVAKLQNLGAAIALAREEGASMSALQPYIEALEMYKESSDLWKLKIDCPAEFNPTKNPWEGECPWSSRTIDRLASKYNAPLARKAETIKAVRYEERLENAQAFDPLMTAIWDNAARTTKQK